MTPQELADAIGKVAHERDLAAHRLGVTLIAMAPGGCTLQMTVRPDMVNSHGTCHGGMIFSLADSAFGYACNSFNRAAVAQQCDITFLRPVPVGAVLTAKAELKSASGRSAIYDMTVTDAEGTIVAMFRGLARTVKGETLIGLTVPSA